MKFNFKSAFIAATLSFVLVGCDETPKMPHVFGGSEVPADVLAEPRLVATPSPEALNGPDWPRLGDVPAKPQSFSPPKVIDEAKKEMEFERTQAEEIKDQYPDTDNPVSSRFQPLTPPQFHKTVY